MLTFFGGIMKKKTMKKLFDELGFIRTGGSRQELKATGIIKDYIEKLGIEAELEDFEVDGDKASGKLIVEGKEIPSKPYRGGKTVKDLTAPFYYLCNNDPYSLSRCKGKIVLFEGGLGRFRYEDLIKNGAVGFISTNGGLAEEDADIDDKELRGYVAQGLDILPGVNINIKEAAKLVDLDPKEVTISITNKKAKNRSHNVVAYLKGEIDDEIVISAHYDSVPLSKGIYDNLSGTIALLAILEDLAQKEHRYSLRFVFCGSEERGLLGSKAYVESHQDELTKIGFCVNLDMVGTTMGRPVAVCSSEEKLCHYLEYRALMKGYPLTVSQGVYSSDSTPFADKGIPAMSFARIIQGDMYLIHNRKDTYDLISIPHMEEDIAFIRDFISDLANARYMPVGKELPVSVRDELDRYNARKRPDKNIR